MRSTQKSRNHGTQFHIDSASSLQIPIWGSKKARSRTRKNSPYRANSSMDQAIWDKIPKDLLILILSHLPIPSIFTTALLSKSFNSLFSSSYFLNLQSHIPHPWLLVFPLIKGFSTLCIAHDPSLNRWIDLSPRLLPNARLFAAGESLICLLYRYSSIIHLFITNPITKSGAEIPLPSSFSRYISPVTGLTSDPITGSFRLAFVGSDQISDLFVLSAAIYDSDRGSWMRTRSFPVSSPASPWRAISNGVMYCVLYYPSMIVALDMKQMSWSVLDASLPDSLTAMRLMDRDGRLVLIGGVGAEGVTEEIGLWQLGCSGKEWEVIGWLEKELCGRFLASNGRLFGCVGGGDVVYFTGKGCRELVLYDILRKEVRFMEPPSCISDPHCHISSGFCFRPRL